MAARYYWIVLLAGGCADLAGIGNPRLEQPDAPQPCVIGGLDLCLFARPQAPLAIDTDLTIDTSRDCNLVVYAPPAPSVCVIYASEIRINAKVRAFGSRALVFAATGLLEVTGTIDVSSSRTTGPGAAANDAACTQHEDVYLEGGAGGSFAGRGGNGGTGSNNAVGQVAGPATALPARVRGGCPGGPYGATDSGGAFWLASTDTIRLAPSARLTANGAGGLAGFFGGGEFGSSGGGSGGMIRIAAQNLELAGIVAANGGGGAEGTDGMTDPASGSDGLVGVDRAPGGKGLSGPGGDGGAGGAGSTPDGGAGLAAEGTVDAAGGGGGGGAGFVQLIANSIDNAAIVSPAPITSAPPGP